MADSFLDKLAGLGGGNLIVGIFFFILTSTIAIQGVSIILTQIFGIKQLALGGVIGLISVVNIILAGFMAVMNPESFSGKTWFTLGILTAVTIFIYFVLPKLQPELFKPAMSVFKVQVMSMLGM